jgi:hypothetical protein
MWATQYKTSNNLNIPYPGILSDGRLFTDYSPSSVVNDYIKKLNGITDNNVYRDYLVKNTNMIMRNNMENTTKENRLIVQRGTYNHGTPYLYQTIDDMTKPIGYEESIPKNIFLSRQQLDDKKKRFIINDAM